MGNILSVIVINIIKDIIYKYQEQNYENAGIYGIKNKINNESIYVGSSVDINRTMKEHLYCVKKK